jgi:hypothetical protein
MALPTAAELRAVFGKDAFRLVARSRLELPRSGKQYKQLKFTSSCFSFDDFGGEVPCPVCVRITAHQEYLQLLN